MFKTEIQWHKASEELPDKSCGVVVACEDADDSEIYGIYTVHFSEYHRKFNCYDFEEEPANSFEDVKYWAYFDEVCSQFQKHEKKTAENGNSQTVNKK